MPDAIWGHVGFSGRVLMAALPWNTDDSQRVVYVQRFHSKGDHHAFEIFSRRQRSRRDAGRYDCMGAKRYE